MLFPSESVPVRLSVRKPRLPVWSIPALTPPSSWMHGASSPGLCIEDESLATHMLVIGTTGSGKSTFQPSQLKILVVSGEDPSMQPWQELSDGEWVLWVNTYLALDSTGIESISVTDCDAQSVELTVEGTLPGAELLAACQEGFPLLTFRIFER